MEIRKIRTFLSPVLIITAVFMSFAAFPFTARQAFAAGSCTSENTTMNIVAHQDDSLLFQSPDLFHDIQSGHCTITVFTTAGDAGSGEAYWLSREDGAKAAYAQMAGVANTWTQADAGIAGHPIPVFTLAADPNVSMIFLRLPDGGVDGGGLSNPVSLKKLWEGSITSLTAIDSSSSYSKQDLIDTFAALYTKYQPSRINTQNYLGSFSGVDHSDHVATGYFSRSAHTLYTTPHTIYAYEGYDSLLSTANVFGTDLDAKISSFFTYTPFDSHACQSFEACAGAYDEWLNRQYIAGSETGGVAPTDVCPNLDGTQASVPGGYHKATDGSCVPNTTAPVCQSFVSDTNDAVNTGGNAVATYVPDTWTAGANIPGATWIWNAFHVADPAEGETVTFTKTINASTTPAAASIVIASDDNYEASLNGTPFGSSADFNNYTAGKEDTYDVTSLIHQGDNTLSITVHNIATGDTDPENNPAGLLYRLDLHNNTCDSSTSAPTTPSTDTNTNSGGSSSSGGGSGSSLPKLRISNPLVTVVPSSGQVLITWMTSRPAYGHVIYGVDTGTPYTLDLAKPNFGYPGSAPTDPALAGHADPDGKVSFHAITLSGLTPGKKYRYRIVSHASPAVTTEEGYFTVPANGAAANESGQSGTLAISDEVDSNAVAQQNAGEIATDTAQASESAITSSTSEATTDQDATSTDVTASGSAAQEEKQNAAAALALSGIKSWQWGIIAVIIVALASWFIFGRKKKNTLS